MERPGWLVDDAESIEREAAPYRDLSPEARFELARAACRAAMRLLALRDDRERVLQWVDPLPASTVAALAKLRAEASRRG